MKKKSAKNPRKKTIENGSVKNILRNGISTDGRVVLKHVQEHLSESPSEESEEGKVVEKFYTGV